MTLNSFFDKIYCINLDERKDRWGLCEEEFRKHGIEGVQRYEGIKGEFDLNKDFGNMGLPEKVDSYKEKRNGRIGCLLSHLSILKEAKEKKYNNILILEDDVQFDKNLAKSFLKYHKQIPADWSLLYFGGNEKGKQKWVNKHIVQVSNMLMAHAIGINSTIFDELIQRIEIKKKPVDLYYSSIQYDYRCYSFYPYLAWQRAGWSDIEQRFRIYDLDNLSPYLNKMLNPKKEK